MTPPRFVGRYVVQRTIGSGGMGELYLATDPKFFDREVAIKVLRAELSQAEIKARFAREARAAGSLSHPNVVTVHDYGETEGGPFIVMEYIHGETLKHAIRHRTQIPLYTKVQWLEQLYAGLAHAHSRGIIHRDIKPANLMLDEHGTLKILDFGIAHLTKTDVTTRLTQFGGVIGTPGYMSPEQITGDPIDEGSDVFAAATVAYELLTGQPAFGGDAYHVIAHRVLNQEPSPIRPLAPEIDERLAELIGRALCKLPRDRPSAGEMRYELEAIRLAMPPVPTPNPGGKTLPLTPAPARTDRHGIRTASATDDTVTHTPRPRTPPPQSAPDAGAREVPAAPGPEAAGVAGGQQGMPGLARTDPVAAPPRTWTWPRRGILAVGLAVAVAAPAWVLWPDEVVSPPTVNRAPTATASCDPCETETGATVTLTASATDPDQDLLQYQWTVSAGTLSDASAAAVEWIAPDSAGRVTATVTVTDEAGGTAQDAVDLHVVAPAAAPAVPAPSNAAPTVRLRCETPRCEAPFEGTVRLRAEAADADGDAIGYAWRVDAGQVGDQGAGATWTPPSYPAAARVTVTVTDARGARAAASVDVVSAAPPSGPAQAEVDQRKTTARQVAERSNDCAELERIRLDLVALAAELPREDPDVTRLGRMIVQKMEIICRR